MADNALEAAGLVKRYGRLTALDSLDLAVPRGAVCGLVGLNGAGKTTALECALGLRRLDAGRVELLGRAPRRLHRARGEVSAVFDRAGLSPHLTVRQCLTHAALLRPRRDRAAGAAEAAGRRLGLGPLLDRKVRRLSLGNRRRAAIAQALVGEPRLVLLDEPFNGLDAGGVEQVLELVGELNRERGVSFLLSSHQLAYLERVCTHVALLHRGRSAAAGPLAALLDRGGRRARLRAADPAAARAALAAIDGARVLDGAEDGLRVALDGLDSAELNRRLVAAGVAVRELVLERASLDGLFRRVTAAAP